MQNVYKPEVFNRKSLEAAKNIIMTEEAGVSRQARWQMEAEWIVDIVEKNIELKNKTVIDFGCGVGRISSVLVERGATVIGVDISQYMREHANTQSLGDGFVAVSPTVLDAMTAKGLQVDLAISIWVLQHCPDLEGDVERILKALKPGGGVFIADMKHRAIPVDSGWHEDHKNVYDYLTSRLKLINQYPYDLPDGPKNLYSNAWIAYFEKW